MGVNYTSQKCPSCGSTSFDYLKDIKMWECRYCGTRIERNEQLDTMFTIKNVVRQVLIDIAYKRFNDAKSNLIECEKIDSRYVGTIISKICFFINASMFNSDISQQEKQNNIAQVKKYYEMLIANGDDVSEEELALYEFFDSAEAYGVLILVFDTLNLNKKLDVIYNFFNPTEIYSMDLNSNLLRFMINKSNFDIADKIVSNYNNLEKKSALNLILFNYPDNDKKTQNCITLLSQNAFSVEDARLIEKYLEQTEDSISTKCDITYEALKTSAKPSLECIMKNVIALVNNENDIKRIFDVIMSKKLLDAEVSTIVDYALLRCNQTTILYIFETLKSTNQFVVLNVQHFISLLHNGIVSNDFRKKIIKIAVDFNVTEKKKEQFISYYLLNISESIDVRKDMLEFLLTLISSLSTLSIENYIVNCSIDGDNKSEIIKMLFSKDVNFSYLRETFDKYIQNSQDPASVYESIINLLADYGLKLSEQILLSLLCGNRDTESKIIILRKVLNSGSKYLTILDKYLLSVSQSSYSGIILQELIECSDSISADALIKYLLYVRESESMKSVNVYNLAMKCNIPFLQKECVVNHLNNNIQCNVIQAYILSSIDPPQTCCAVLDVFGARQMKLNTEIYINGSRKKLKKYLSSCKASLSVSTVEMCKYLDIL